MDHPEEGERKSWGYLPIFLTRDATPASAHLLSSLMLESVRESYPFTELRMPRCASCFSAQLFVLLLRHCRGWQRVRGGFFVNFPFFRVTQFYKCAGQQLLYLEKRSVCACGGGWVQVQWVTFYLNASGTADICVAAWPKYLHISWVS